MASPADAPVRPEGTEASRPTGTVRGLLGGRHWTTYVGLTVFGFVVLVLLLTPWIAPYDPNAQALGDNLSGPDGSHWLGTDHLGRDVLSRLMHGGRFSVTIAAITLLISAVVGTIIGALSARIGGLFDEIVMRVVDLLISFPDVIVALFLVALIGRGYGTLIIALSVVGWTPFARMVRGVTLEINATGYIQAAEALGCSRWFIVWRHVIPNALPPVLAIGFLRFGHKLITVGALSYLDLGVQPPNSDWGAMLSDAGDYMTRLPMLALAPGFAIFLTALSVTMAGQGLERGRVRARRKTAEG